MDSSYETHWNGRADKEAIKALYREAAEKTRETGIKHEVDHVVPLQGDLVSGLHWEGNMRDTHRRQFSNGVFQL